MDEDFVGEAVTGLQSSPVYVDPSASLSQHNQIESDFKDHSTAVVALPPDATRTFGPNGVAGQILAEADGYDTVIVVVDGSRDSFGVASHGDDNVIAHVLNSKNTGDGGAALIASETQLFEGSTLTGGSALPGVVGVGAGLVGLLVVLAGGWIVFKRLGIAAGDGFRRGSKPGAIDLDKVPADAREKVEQFRRTVQLQPAGPLRDKLDGILTNLEELFVRIGRQGDTQQGRLAAVEYDDILAKLNRAIGPDYYLDIAAKPDLWDNPQGRLKEVEDAVEATANQLVANIRQVNASRDLEFKVALESLVGSMDAPKVTEMFDPDPKDSK